MCENFFIKGNKKTKAGSAVFEHCTIGKDHNEKGEEIEKERETGRCFPFRKSPKNKAKRGRSALFVSLAFGK